MITVVLVDDQVLVRAGLRTLLERDADIAIVGEAEDGRSGVQMVRTTRPSVVLMDIRMPVMDGLEATRQIVGDTDLHETTVVVLTTFDEDEYIDEAIRVGRRATSSKIARPRNCAMQCMWLRAAMPCYRPRLPGG